MIKPISRRDVLLRVATAGACALAQEVPLQLAGHPAEITLTPVTHTTVRISVQPLENGVPVPVPVTGALVEKGWGRPVARIRGLTTPRSVKCGDLTVKISNRPFSIRVEAKDGRMIQELKI